MRNLYLGALSIVALLSWSCTQASAAQVLVQPGYAECAGIPVLYPATPPQTAGETTPVAVSAPISLTCHDEWTRVYASLAWNAVSENERLVWKPVLSYGPDLTFEAIGSSGETKPIVTLSSGQTAKLVWRTSPDTTSCEADGYWEGPKTTSGEAEVIPPLEGTNTYLLRCFSKAGVKSLAMALVVVRAEDKP
jgi:hypothetical protein